MLREVCYQGVRGRMIHVGDATGSVLSGGKRSYDTCRRCYGKCVIRG